jgi:hypothetical protein
VRFQFLFKPLEQGEGVGGAPANPPTTLPSPSRRTFLALGLMTVLPRLTWPSPAMTVLPPFFTPRMVVP